MNDIVIGTVKKEDLVELSKEYVKLYDNADIGEHWTEETAYRLLEYWFNMQQDLFLVASVNNKVVGAVMSGIKPWWDGIHLTDTEIFVSEEYQKLGIAKMLYIKHFELAKEKYNAVEMEAHTYKDENGFPFSWYEKMGFEEDNGLIIIRGNVDNALQKLNNNGLRK